MNFIPKSDEETELMLKEIGLTSLNDLFIDIPKETKQDSDLPNPMPESELKKQISGLADKNKNYKVSFLGAGSYSHYIPSIVNHIVSRSEFYTAYTPYQAELSQGILQAIFEYQTMICRLTGMDVSNASLYDGAEALAEAAVISINKTGRDELIISKAVHPEYRETVRTYLDARDKKLIEIGFTENGITDLTELRQKINENTAGVLVQSPNFFGLIENIPEIEKISHSNNSLLTLALSDPSCLGILKSPADLKADIAVAEGQSLGNPKNFGGPYLGIIAVKNELMRYMPGRIVGQTVDKENNTGYTLTLQAREQHIRREKASCNICSNEALNALAATVYIAALGKEGMVKLANLNIQKTNYCIEELKKQDVLPKFSQSLYNEFVIETKNIEKLKQDLEKISIEPGLHLSGFYPGLENCMLFCITELCTKQHIDELVKTIVGSNR